MVLICNNSVLTIETFHKNRCIEKSKIRDILIDHKYNKDRFKEEPEKERAVTRSYSEFLTSLHRMTDETKPQTITLNRR